MKTPSAPKVQTYTFPNGNNGGMNTRLQADQIRTDQSPDMLNMNYREGVPSNRHGFNTEYDLDIANKKIRGLHATTIGANSYFLVVCDGKLLVID